MHNSQKFLYHQPNLINITITGLNRNTFSCQLLCGVHAKHIQKIKQPYISRFRRSINHNKIWMLSFIYIHILIHIFGLQLLKFVVNTHTVSDVKPLFYFSGLFRCRFYCSSNSVCWWSFSKQHKTNFYKIIYYNKIFFIINAVVWFILKTQQQQEFIIMCIMSGL